MSNLGCSRNMHEYEVAIVQKFLTGEATLHLLLVLQGVASLVDDDQV